MENVRCASSTKGEEARSGKDFSRPWVFRSGSGWVLEKTSVRVPGTVSQAFEPDPGYLWSLLNSFAWFNLTHDLLFRYQSYLKNISFCRKNWMKWFCHSNWSLFIWVSILISQLIDEFLLSSASQVKISRVRVFLKGKAVPDTLFIRFWPLFYGRFEVTMF